MFGDPVLYGFYAFSVFLYGAIFGSFFNVCIYRIPRGVALSRPASHCYRCGQPIRWSDNIPLVSYWVLGGRCRHCGIKFSSRYFWIELLTACLFLSVFLRYCRPSEGFSWVLVPGVVLTGLLLIASFTDLDHWIIPDGISKGGTVAGIALAVIWPLGASPGNPLGQEIGFLSLPPQLLPVVNSLAGAGFGYGVLWGIGVMGAILFRKEAMGQGDMKLFAMIGAFIGPMNTLISLVLACLFGSVVGLAGMAWGWFIRGRPVHPAIAPLTAQAHHYDDMERQYDLLPGEILALTSSFVHPSTTVTSRHHLPFGPSLALASFVVFMAWEPLQEMFASYLLGPPL